MLKNKVIVVSGVGPGLGIKLAMATARAGARGVVMVARNAGRLAEAKSRVDACGTDCQPLAVPADITSESDCAALVECAVAKFGRIDGLVNSAYNPGNVMKSIAETELADWRPVLETNLFGTMTLTQAVVPQMKKQKDGAIVMISSMVTRKPLLGQAGYAISKGALGVAAKYLAHELGPLGIRVNTVAMGWMWGAPVEGYMKHVEATHGVTVDAQVAAVASNIPLGRIPTDDECAQAALFMVSDHARAITGAWLDANGGEFMAQ